MAKKKPMYPLEPQGVDKSTWLYFERKGVCVVRQIRNKEDVLVQSDMFYLPWRSILTAAKVRRRAKSRPSSTRADK